MSFTYDLFIVPVVGQCEYGNKTYDINQAYITLDCKESCTCNFVNGTAKPKCDVLCSNSDDPVCRNDTEEIEEYLEPVRGSNCSCPAKRCIRGLKLFKTNQIRCYLI